MAVPIYYRPAPAHNFTQTPQGTIDSDVGLSNEGRDKTRDSFTQGKETAVLTTHWSFKQSGKLSQQVEGGEEEYGISVCLKPTAWFSRDWQSPEKYKVRFFNWNKLFTLGCGSDLLYTFILWWASKLFFTHSRRHVRIQASKLDMLSDMTSNGLFYLERSSIWKGKS